MIIKVIATQDIGNLDRVFVSQGFVRLASVGADKNTGIAYTPLSRGEVGNYNMSTRELRRAPKERR